MPLTCLTRFHRHVFCTHVSGGRGQGGYPGVIWHWVLNSTDVFDDTKPWINAGMALNASHKPGTFDAFGVFTPGAVRECSGSPGNQVCKWFLFFGGVPSDDRSHAENVGVSMSDSPWGPFERYGGNPVFRYTDANSAWCNGQAARVDEIKSSVVQGHKVMLVKSVCNNFTALPVVYSPLDNSSWGPPYQINTAPGQRPAPLFPATETCGGHGFEEPTLYVAPDGHLHFHGHNHGQCTTGTYSHYISAKHQLRGDWLHAPEFKPGQAMEPVPIPASGDGVFGGAILSKWIDFPGTQLNFMNVTWTWSNASKQ